jgi:hypothetical protein
VVKFSKVIQVDATSPMGIPVDVKSVTIYDDLGNSEELSHVKPVCIKLTPMA